MALNQNMKNHLLNSFSFQYSEPYPVSCVEWFKSSPRELPSEFLSPLVCGHPRTTTTATRDGAEEDSFVTGDINAGLDG